MKRRRDFPFEKSPLNRGVGSGTWRSMEVCNMITKRRPPPASGHAKRPPERPTPNSGSSRATPAAVIARRPAKHPAPRSRIAPTLVIGVTPRPRKPRPDARAGAPRSLRRPRAQ
jgi:hypothetical protein